MKEKQIRGPVVTSDLFEFQTDQLRREVEQRASSEASRAAHAFAGWVTEQIREAYMRGLKDGYAQGAYVQHTDPQPAPDPAP